MDAPFVEEYTSLWRAYLSELKSMAAAAQQLGPSFRRLLSDKAIRISLAGTRYSNFKLLTINYSDVPTELTSYKSSEELSLVPKSLIESFFGPIGPDEKVAGIYIMSVYADGSQIMPLKVGGLPQFEVHDNAEIAMSVGAYYELPAPSLKEWPIGPPPQTDPKLDGVIWEVPGAEPAMAKGKIYRGRLANAKEIEKTLGTRVQVSLPSEYSGDAIFLRVYPDSMPEVCLSVPSSTRRGMPTVISWKVTAEKGNTPIQWFVDIPGSDVRSIEITGNPIQGARAVVFAKVGRYEIRATAKKGRYVQNATAFIVVGENHPPRFLLSGNITSVKVGDSLRLTFRAVDDDPGDKLFFELTLPEGIEPAGFEDCDKTGQTLRCTTQLTTRIPGRFDIGLEVVDQGGKAAVQKLQVRVLAE